MLQYLIRRLLQSLLAVWAVLTLVFLIERLSGDPALLLLPVGASAQQVHQLDQALGFTSPLPVQYVTFLREAVVGNFGDSLYYGQPALPLVLQHLQYTAELVVGAMILAIMVGGIVGLVAALQRGRIAESIVVAAAVVVQSIPSFWLGLVLILVFAVTLRWFPASGSGQPSSIVLPVVTLAGYSMATIARLFRSSLIDVMSEDYIRTAVAKGLSRRQVVVRHMIRNAALPVVTMIGLQTGLLLGGTVVIETVFAWPGAGWLVVQSVENRDFPVVEASVTVLAVAFVLINLLVDLSYSVIDPRIRLGGD